MFSTCGNSLWRILMNANWHFREGPTTFACKSKNADRQGWYISIKSLLFGVFTGGRNTCNNQCDILLWIVIRTMFNNRKPCCFITFPKILIHSIAFYQESLKNSNIVASAPNFTSLKIGTKNYRIVLWNYLKFQTLNSCILPYFPDNYLSITCVMRIKGPVVCFKWEHLCLGWFNVCYRYIITHSYTVLQISSEAN